MERVCSGNLVGQHVADYLEWWGSKEIHVGYGLDVLVLSLDYVVVVHGNRDATRRYFNSETLRYM